jgi:tRNA threonylcarbamoyl adenosine modification protein YjeE
MANSRTVQFDSPEQTAIYAAKLAKNLAPEDIILLNGDVGAGKSYFCRALIQSVLQYEEDIPSPTFTLVQQYDTEIGELWHADLYRLSDPTEVVELGLLDAMESAIILIEWPDQITDFLPNSALNININTSDHETRVFHLSWTDNKWDEKLSGHE